VRQRKKIYLRTWQKIFQQFKEEVLVCLPQIPCSGQRDLRDFMMNFLNFFLQSSHKKDG